MSLEATFVKCLNLKTEGNLDLETQGSSNRVSDQTPPQITSYRNKQISDYELQNAISRKISNIMKVSCDSSTMPASGTNIEPCSNSKLKLKVEEFKSNKIVTKCANVLSEKENHHTDHGSTARGVKDHEKKISNYLQKNSNFRKESKESGFYGNSNLDESFIPPQIIDNSAMLFSNTKKRETQLKKEQINNALNTDFDKSFNDYKSATELQNENDNAEGERDEDGEGESYSSSCSCSSCLRERNADNGVSLKLSQYEYKPTYTGYQTHTEERSVVVDNESNFQSSLRKGSSPRYFYNCRESDIEEEDESNDGSVSPDNRSRDEYPDNLNNGKFKFQLKKM